MPSRHCLAIVVAGIVMPSLATASPTVTTSFASEEVRAAAQRPAIAAALAAGERTANAILAQDAAGFAAAESPELMVNSPADRVLSGAQTVGAFKAGLINYASSERVIEYAAVRPTGEVLLMGAEHITPLDKTRNAGKAVTYRVTEIWRPEGGAWKLSVRQATITEVR